MMRRVLTLFVIVCWAFALLVPSHAQSVDDQRRALDDARREGAAAAQRAAALEAKAKDANTDVERVRARIAALAARIQATEADVTTGEKRVAYIDQLRREQSAKLAQKQEPVVRLLAALQLMSKRPTLLSFVQPGSTRDLVHVRAVLDTIIPQIRKKTEGLRQEIAVSQDLRGKAFQAVELLKQGKVRLNEQRQQLAQEEAGYRATYQQLSGSAMAEQDRAIAMGEKARDITDLIGKLGASSQLASQLASLPGPLMRPDQPTESNALPPEQAAEIAQFTNYRLPVTGALVRGLGDVSDAGVRARGLTIATRPGAQVIAPSSGRVIFAGGYRGYGQIVIIDHGGGWTTLVTNLASLDVSVGDGVNSGSPIGKAGTDRPTITVELRKGQQPVDITPLL